MFATNLVRRGLITKINNLRFLSIGNPKYSAQESPLYILRQRTGLAYSLCREALNKHDNQIDQAEVWLKAQALALGLQKATKVRDRSAKEGLIGLTVSENNMTATILKLNCESDFVAKNQLFKDLVLDLTQRVSSLNLVGESVSLVNDKIKMCTGCSTDQLDALSQHIVPLISRLGENIKVEKVQQFKSQSHNVRLFGQTHSENYERSLGDCKLLTGRFASIVGLEDLSTDQARTKSLTPFGNRLCRHVIGYNPTYIELPEVLREQLENARYQAIESAKTISLEKSDEEDKEADSDSEDNFNFSSRDDWPSMMDQTLIMSDDITVRQFCEENNFSLVYFSRLECGQTD